MKTKSLLTSAATIGLLGFCATVWHRSPAEGAPDTPSPSLTAPHPLSAIPNQSDRLGHPDSESSIAPTEAGVPAKAPTDSVSSERMAHQSQRADELLLLAQSDGLAATEALLLEEDADLRRGLLGSVLAVWADHQPIAALAWYHDADQDRLADSGHSVPPRFYSSTFRALALEDFQAAANSLTALEEPFERQAAIRAVIEASKELDRLPDMLDALGNALPSDVSAEDSALIQQIVDGQPEGSDLSALSWEEEIDSEDLPADELDGGGRADGALAELTP